ncbi:MAG: nucleotidyl transferase AbiEii/AbiGii toxin family protein [Deltaproteobacteria bacterium]|nr:nucleotidyl transferase AbiEii/AbiGii toxin family protein [Deltaproteobacteria bacterium]
MPYEPAQVIPASLSTIVDDIPYWFVIGGQAVRCLCPYRPSRDVDFGVENVKNLDALMAVLQQRGTTEILERSNDTVHLLCNDIKISIFSLPILQPFIEGKRLGVTGILATKMHAIIDRGLRRDFFDLYVVLQSQKLSINDCLTALRTVYNKTVPDGLLLRALTYFDDAAREAALPGEGINDFSIIKDFFIAKVGSLITPPHKTLAIQSQQIDIHD